MLQLEVVGGALNAVAAARQEIPADPAQPPQLRTDLTMDVVRQMLRRHPFRGRKVVAALPRNILHIKNLRLPNIPANELQAAVQFEARNVFPFDIAEAHLEFLHAGDVRQASDVRHEVIVMAARHEELNAYVEQLHAAGVIIESLDAEPCALFRTAERFLRRKEDENEAHVLVDIGLRRCQVVIGKGRDLSFWKSIDIGGQHLDEDVAKRVGITIDEARTLRRRMSQPPEESAPPDPVRQAVCDATRGTMEQLGKEISLCLRYHSVTFRGQRPIRLQLLGGEAHDHQLITILNGVLPIPVQPGHPLQSVDLSRLSMQQRQGPMSDWAMALGLALKRTTERFGSREGTPRAQQAKANASPETIDEAASPTETPSPEKQEAVHA